MREALSRLEAERLVTAISNRGFAVAPVSREELGGPRAGQAGFGVAAVLESIEKGGNDWESVVLTAHYRLSRCKTAGRDFPRRRSTHGMKSTRHSTARFSARRSNWLLRFRLTISDQLRRHHRFLGLAPAVRVAAGQKKGCREAWRH